MVEEAQSESRLAKLIGEIEAMFEPAVDPELVTAFVEAAHETDEGKRSETILDISKGVRERAIDVCAELTQGQQRLASQLSRVQPASAEGQESNSGREAAITEYLRREVDESVSQANAQINAAQRHRKTSVTEAATGKSRPRTRWMEI